MDVDPKTSQSEDAGIFLTVLRKAVDVRRSEIGALFLGFTYYFLILSSYYVIRPIRDDVGAANLENLPWMFTGTLVTMVLANGMFAKLVARFSRRRFIPIAYRFFIVNLLLFFFLKKSFKSCSVSR